MSSPHLLLDGGVGGVFLHLGNPSFNKALYVGKELEQETGLHMERRGGSKGAPIGGRVGLDGLQRSLPALTIL